MSGIADQLRIVQKGDPIPHEQWNLMVRCARRDVTGTGVVSHAGGWALRPTVTSPGASFIGWGLITAFGPADEQQPEPNDTNKVTGRRVFYDSEEDFYGFDETQDEETYQCEPGIANVDYAYALYDPSSVVEDLILRLYQMPEDDRVFIEQKLPYEVLTGEPANPVSQCQIAMQGGMFG